MKKDSIFECLSNLNDIDLAYLWDKVCDEENYPDDKIYHMHDFEEMGKHIVETEGATELARMITEGEFSIDDDWWWINGQGNLCSTGCLSESGSCPVDFSLMIDYLIDHGDDDGLINKKDLTDDFLEEFPEINKDELKEKFIERVDTQTYDLLYDDWGSICYDLIYGDKE